MFNILNCALALGITSCVALYPTLNNLDQLKRVVNYENLRVYTENYSGGASAFTFDAPSDTDNNIRLSFNDSVYDYYDDAGVGDLVPYNNAPAEFLLCKVASNNSTSDYSSVLMMLSANVVQSASTAALSETGITYRSYIYLNASLNYNYDSLVAFCGASVTEWFNSDVSIYFAYASNSFSNQVVTINNQDFYRFSFGFDDGYHGVYSWEDIAFDNTTLSFNYYITMFDGSSLYNDGYQKGYVDGYDDGYTIGYSQGLSVGQNGTAKNLWMSIVDTPILMVRSLFNFDFFGVNMYIIVAGLLTTLFVIFIVKKVIK